MQKVMDQLQNSETKLSSVMQNLQMQTSDDNQILFLPTIFMVTPKFKHPIDRTCAISDHMAIRETRYQ